MEHATDGGEVRRRRRWVVPVAVAAAVALVVSLVFVLRNDGPETSGGVIGRVAPRIEGPVVGDGTVDLRALRGRPVIVNFWASWCVPCRREFPVLAELRERHPGVALVGVASKDTEDAARAFMDEQGADWPSAVDRRGEVATSYGVVGLPVTFAVDARGVVRARHIGELGRSDLDALVAAAN